MFTGIVQELGEVCLLATRGNGLSLGVQSSSEFAHELVSGDSVAVDGVCLTVVRRDGNRIFFDVIPETLACTTIGERSVGDKVNLEGSLRMGDSMGGHLVSGHVLGTAEIVAIEENRYYFHVVENLAPYLFEKGFIAVDGASLTIVSVDGAVFSVGLIPETLQRTTLGYKREKARVNIEIETSTKIQVDTLRRLMKL
ncbi:riboflavin synthase [Candidatus Chlamydia sanziniae]|uniref:Riboflavin synthase n=1 Tax=Candidatus Chlamydia sanziniae TaxID=1806891 RepID=A0A1A9HUE1_9CHLA|nr:riboflavin synthase [Candidatus Chlamydia sanziniae]ANH78327.1 Riboflavin synthase [Candidatus Chlamydia sanziniae]